MRGVPQSGTLLGLFGLHTKSVCQTRHQVLGLVAHGIDGPLQEVLGVHWTSGHRFVGHSHCNTLWTVELALFVLPRAHRAHMGRALSWARGRAASGRAAGQHPERETL